MGDFHPAVNALLQFLQQLITLAANALTALDSWLRGQMDLLGVPPTIQTLIILAVSVFLIIGALRVLGGLIRVGAVLILVLVVIHFLMPH